MRALLASALLAAAVPLASAQDREPPPGFDFELRGVLGDTALFEPSGGGRQILRRRGETIGPYRVVRISGRAVEIEGEGGTHTVEVAPREGGDRPGPAADPLGTTREYDAARRALASWRISIRAEAEPVTQVIGRLETELGLPVEWTARATAAAARDEAGVTLATPPIPLAEALRLLLAPRGLAATATEAGLTIHAAGEDVASGPEARLREGLARAIELAGTRARGPSQEFLDRLATKRVDLEASGRSLAEILAFLGGEIGVPVELDPSVRHWAERSGGLRIDETFEDASVEEVLHALLDPLGLVHEAGDDRILVSFVSGSGDAEEQAEDDEALRRLDQAFVPAAVAGWTVTQLLERLSAGAGVPLRYLVPLVDGPPVPVALRAGSSIAENVDAVLATAGLVGRIVDGVLVVGPADAFEAAAQPAEGDPLAARIDVQLDHATFLEAVQEVGRAAGLEIAVDLSALDLARGRRYDDRLTGTAASALERVVGGLGLTFTRHGRTVQIHPASPHPELGASLREPEEDPLAGRVVDVESKKDDLLETLSDLVRAGGLQLQIDLAVLDSFKDRRYTRRFQGPLGEVLSGFLAPQGLGWSVQDGVVRVFLYDAVPGPLGGSGVEADFEDASFLEVVSHIARAAGVGAVVDEAVLEILRERGLARFSPRFTGQTPDQALAVFLGPLGFGHEVRGGVLHVFAVAPTGADDRMAALMAATPVPDELIGVPLEASLAAAAGASGVEIALGVEASVLYRSLGAPLVPNGLGQGTVAAALERILSPLGLSLAPEGGGVVVVPEGATSGDTRPLERPVDVDVGSLPLAEAISRVLGPLDLAPVFDPALEAVLDLELPAGERYVGTPLARVLEDLLGPSGAAFAVRGRFLYVYPLPPEPDEGRAMRTRLATRVDLSVDDARIGEVLEELAERAGFEVRIDPAALRALAEEGDDRVTARHVRTPLSTILGEILTPRGLDYFAGKGFLFVSDFAGVDQARSAASERESARQGERETQAAILAREFDFRFEGTSWDAFGRELERLTGLPVVSDPRARALRPEVTLAGRMTLGDALDRVEDEHGVAWILHGGAIYLVGRR